MSSDDVTTTEDSDTKKSSKPVMEKRRRARINASLAELKSLLMGVMKSEGCRHNKMEKADILEMTVRHLRNLQTCSRTDRVQNMDHTKESKFQLGYTECINEVGRFLNSLNIEEVDLKLKVIEHLAGCASGSSADDTEDSMAVSSTTPLVPQSAVSADSRNQCAISTTSMFSSVYPGSVRENNVEEKLNTIRDVRIISNESGLQINSALSISPRMGLPGDKTPGAKPEDITASCSLSPASGKHERHIENTCKIQPRPESNALTPINSVRTLFNAADTVSPSQMTLVPTHTHFPTPAPIFSGLHLVPAQLPNGTIAFVVPTSFANPTAILTPPTPSGIVLPVYAPQTISISPSKSDSLIQTYNENSTKVSDAIECSDEKSSSSRTHSAFSPVSPTRSNLLGACSTGTHADSRCSSKNARTHTTPPMTTPLCQKDLTIGVDNSASRLDKTVVRSVETSAGKTSKAHSKAVHVLDTHRILGKTVKSPLVSKVNLDVVHKDESSVEKVTQRKDLHGRFVVGVQGTSSDNERIELSPPGTGQDTWRPW